GGGCERVGLPGGGGEPAAEPRNGGRRDAPDSARRPRRRRGQRTGLGPEPAERAGASTLEPVRRALQRVEALGRGLGLRRQLVLQREEDGGLHLGGHGGSLRSPVSGEWS